MTPAYTFMAQQAMKKLHAGHAELVLLIKRRLMIAENESREEHGLDSRFLLTGEMHYRHEDRSFWLQYTARFGDGTHTDDCWCSLDPKNSPGLGGGLIYAYSLEDMVKGQY